MNLETNQYIATPADVEKIAHIILESDQNATNGRGTYLKSMVATLQAEIQSPPRFRNVRADRLNEEEITAHLTAFETVFARFHEAVVKVATSLEPKLDADTLRSRTGFSRSAGSTVRGFIRAGNDIRALAAHKVTKAALSTPRAKRKFTVESLKQRVATLAEALAQAAKNLNAANREIARETLAPVLAMLAEAAGATEHATRDAEKAVAEGLPLHTKTGMFVPIDFAAARKKAA
jgi:hypothetical protein